MNRSELIQSLPEGDPAGTLRPIRFLVLGAVVFALLAGLALFLSVMHVMSTTDAMSMADERARAAQIADILPYLPDQDMTEAVAALGAIAGLHDLKIAPAASREDYAQSIPLLSGPRGGQFLVWTSDRPGLVLLQTHAPVRVPLILTLIAGVLACLLLMLRHVRRIESQRREAQRQALRDHLTGLPNLRAFEAELARRVAAGQRFSVLALDLDRFKPINDLFGHHAGDLALVDVGKRLASQLRDGEFLARIGGDEFVVIARRGDQRKALIQLARDCIAAVGRPLHIVGNTMSVGISLGIVEKGQDHPAEALLKLADRALYQAKELEGGAFCFAGEVGAGRVGKGGQPKRLLSGAGR